ncbi:dihydrofolate reductase family protein [Nocardia puris]|uniref:dihydrofolate reductase family protein n=1 Tax=Nocardia puris TaxID=208602 RepID=UPI001893E5DC|nr:dihydrofolate reductase family protein [Nocardia puris]MBF6211991.1 dihydrofolate reductase family protein [Nocardia puris]MBF6367017.1 dihydrofolate reductase family protein [Nocardia puris]MBF6462006.1 dihydrofolate reductase family protein [Nocardia puris]
MELSLTQFISLDGVYQAPGGPEEDPSDGFTQGGWTAPFVDEGFGSFVDSAFARADAFLFGRRTYDIFASYWPKVGDEEPVAKAFNALPKYVASRTLDRADWAGTEILGGDVVEQVEALKQRPGRELQMHGSGGLAQTLLAAGLIDTLYLLTFPVVLGNGRRLFPAGAAPTRFRLAESRTTGTGVVLGTYRADGAPEYGLIGE